VFVLRCCGRLLGVDDAKASLDIAISNMTGRSVINAQLDTEDMTKTLDKLRRRISQLETETEDLVQTAGDLQRQLDERDREIAKLRHMVHID